MPGVTSAKGSGWAARRAVTSRGEHTQPPMPAPAAAINPPTHTPWAVPPAAVASFAAHGVAVLPGFAPPDAVDEEG